MRKKLCSSCCKVPNVKRLIYDTIHHGYAKSFINRLSVNKYGLYLINLHIEKKNVFEQPFKLHHKLIFES